MKSIRDLIAGQETAYFAGQSLQQPFSILTSVF
jgi:hypothetical protein